MGKVEFQLHSFVTLALDGSELPRHIKNMEPSYSRTVIGANLFSGKITLLIVKIKRFSFTFVLVFRLEFLLFFSNRVRLDLMAAAQ
jgi:hypothetical protein